MAINPHIEAEYINITIPQQITINKLLENTSQQMSDKFIKYSAYGNNCQDFIQNILLSNNRLIFRKLHKLMYLLLI